MIGSKVILSTDDESGKEYIVKRLLDDNIAEIKSGDEIKQVSILDLEKIVPKPSVFTFDVPEQKEAAGKENVKIININSSEMPTNELDLNNYGMDFEDNVNQEDND